jgi:hypothetical protein
VIVLVSHLPDASHFESERFDVVGIECSDPFDYWRGVEAHWASSETLCVVEHDMEVSDELIQSLLDCPHGLCSWAYWLGIPSGGPHWAHRTGRKPPCGGVWVETGDEWADYGGIGFCKITPEARVRPLAKAWDAELEAWRPHTWQSVDVAVFASIDVRVHLHWPAVEHQHV